MSIPVQISTTRATRYVTPTSRYADSQVFIWGEQGIITFETYKRPEIALRKDDKFSVVPAGEEYRPDKTSYRAYGTPDYWWKIMQINGMHDIFDYKAGTNIRIPSAFGVV